MILSIQAEGYKSLADIDVNMRPLTLLVGPNAAGKSNLLDALSLLSAIGTGPDLKRAFEEHRGDPAEAFHYQRGRLQDLFDQEAVSFT
ncbi:MAG: AAA family ATPase, partial [Armatimonadota bacterium]